MSNKRGDFNAWFDRVDVAIESLCGMRVTTLDLADIAYYDMWQDGSTPQEAAREALANEGYYV